MCVFRTDSPRRPLVTRRRKKNMTYIRCFYICFSLLTFISTDSLSFSRLIILMATFLPSTQCTPSLTRPVIKLICHCHCMMIACIHVASCSSFKTPFNIMIKKGALGAAVEKKIERQFWNNRVRRNAKVKIYW